MKKILFSFFILLMLASCKRKDRVPGNIIPQKKMQSVLWDIMRADQFLSDYVLNRDSAIDKTKERLKYYQQVFSIHKISKEEFDRSFKYYSTRPDLFRDIMDTIAAPPADTAKSQQVIKPTIDSGSTIRQPARPVRHDSLPKFRRSPVMGN